MYLCKFGQNLFIGSKDNIRKQSNVDSNRIPILLRLGDIILLWVTARLQIGFLFIFCVIFRQFFRLRQLQRKFKMPAQMVYHFAICLARAAAAIQLSSLSYEGGEWVT